ncbi:MAG: hydroxymethylglutaryl-CoA lyase [Bacteroidota bacterium]
MSKHIILEEQGLRDGIQNLPHILPTEKKIEYLKALIDAGLSRIQVASFVHPKLVPQMADAAEVCKSLPQNEGVLFSGLVLNLKGVERGIEAGLKHLACSISASNTHSQKNARKTLEEAKDSFKEMVKISQKHGIAVRGGIQCAFGCRYEGLIDPGHVLDMVKHHLDTGIDEIALADSTGMGNPKAIEEIMGRVVEEANGKAVILHLHNTENKGYVNMYAALRVGVRHFDTAFGGLGGCPFIKNATGNIATEDSVNMLHQMGYETGIELDKLAKLSQDMSEYLNQELPGLLYKLKQDPDMVMI